MRPRLISSAHVKAIAAAVIASTGLLCLPGTASAGIREARVLIDNGDLDGAYAEALKGQKAGDVEAAGLVAAFNFNRATDPRKSTDEAWADLTRLAESGSAEAAYWQGDFYQRRGDYQTAFRLYTQAVLKKHGWATYARASMYEQGQVDVASEFDRKINAYTDYRSAAELGLGMAWMKLGILGAKGMITNGRPTYVHALAYLTVALEKLTPAEERTTRSDLVAYRNQVAGLLSPLQVRIANEGAAAGRKEGPSALSDKVSTLLEKERDQRLAGNRDNRASQGRDESARKPLCLPDTNPAVDCEGPRVR
ncbi:hypothetical protein MW290_22215 [Aquincola tertiaricarbonis]|uniref:Sel1 repeat family protein n=1 Tax=Aquincola tertiaricarbonis TaxID=391953 RepID=A0ABY4SE95_AQUTE|nr:hypothetical protein [Aquincola tertiaricarbonis]URI11647.1 hypothetical protein MW290_22215 [Aquincola tertiaricarbonis]